MKSYLKILYLGFLSLGFLAFVSCFPTVFLPDPDSFPVHSYEDAKYLYIDIIYEQSRVNDTVYCLTDEHESKGRYGTYAVFHSSDRLLSEGLISAPIITRVYESKRKKSLIHESTWIAIESKDLEKENPVYTDLRFKVPFEKKPVYVEIFQVLDGKKRYLDKSIYTKNRALDTSSLSKSSDGCAREIILI